MKIKSCRIDSLYLNALVSEEGTGIERTASTKKFEVSTTGVHFKAVYEDAFVKPNLPYKVQVGEGNSNISRSGGNSVNIVCTNAPIIIV